MASAGANGTISPSGAVSVNWNASQSFTITPAAHYHVADVLVDGSSVGAVTNYTFNNVVANHTISASFAIDTYTITASAGANGTISPSGAVSVNWNASQSFTITPAAHYHVADVLVDGGSVGAVTSYTFNNVVANHTISATFAINTYTLTYTAGVHGSISGTSPQTVNYGADGTAVTAVPDTGYNFVNWSDGSTDNPRTDTNVTADISVTANFATSTYKLTYLAIAHGTISGTTPQMVGYGGSGTPVTAVPDAGYHFVNWSDGVLTATRTDTDVTSNITVIAIFAPNFFTLTVDATNGSVTKSPDLAGYDAGTTVVLTAIPNAGYHFTVWSGDFPPGHETDNPLLVTMDGNKTLTANFAINVYTVVFQTDGTVGATLTGTTTQMVNYGANCTAVRANAPTNYHFVKWTKDGVNYSTDNPLTVTNVTENMTLTAIFAATKQSSAKNWQFYE